MKTLENIKDLKLMNKNINEKRDSDMLLPMISEKAQADLSLVLTRRL